MTEKNQIYKCNICGNIVEVLHAGMGKLVCCGEPMNLLVQRNEDTGMEKHVPVVEKTNDGVKVKVGSIAHPMEKEHYIEWIEVIGDGRIYRKFLNAGDEPVAEFDINAENVVAREYCTVHGLWKS